MSRKTILIAVLIILISLTSAAAVFLYITNYNQPSDHSILVILLDDTDNLPGIGSADFGFVIQLNNDDITNLTPIYPKALPLPNATPPLELENVGITKLYFIDSLYDVDLNTGTKHAQEIVEDDKGLKTDSVVIIRPAAIDAILTSLGGVEINGSLVTNNSLSFLREEQNEGNLTRADAVESMGYAIQNAAQNSSKRSAMIQAITIQYAKGNIVVIPNNLFYNLITQEAMKKLF
ncbi:MAG: DUF4012 domain-containing protein [Methanobacterium sp.]